MLGGRQVEEFNIKGFEKFLASSAIPQLKRELRAVHIGVSLQELAFEQRRGNLRNFVLFVDNLPNKQLRKVKFGGKIEFKDQSVFGAEAGAAERPVNVAREVMKLLVQHSPRRDGEYMLNHYLFANGKQVAPNSNPPLNTPQDTLIFVNRMPYAKRLEGPSKPGPKAKQVASIRRRRNRDNRARRALGNENRELTPFERQAIEEGAREVEASREYMSSQAPNGIYNAVGKKLQRLYRGRLNIRFTYLTNGLDFTGSRYGGPERTGAKGGDGGRIRGLYVESGRRYIFPALIITLANNNGQFDGIPD